MWTIPLFLAGAGILVSLSPDASVLVMDKLASFLPAAVKGNAASAWFDGHQPAALMYLSLALFFVTRTVSRLVDR